MKIISQDKIKPSSMLLTVLIIILISAFCLFYISSSSAYGTGIASEAEIVQHEEISIDLMAEILQEGSQAGDWAFIEQEGEDSEADIMQADGRFNEAETAQSGNDLYLDTVQTGRMNRASVRQRGRGHEAFIDQQSAENEAVILQTGANNRAIINQNGRGNEARIVQRAGG